MHITEAARTVGQQIIESKNILIGRYVYSANKDGNLKRVENEVYARYKKEGVGATVVIEQGAPGIKRFTYTIKNISSDYIELIEKK